jgi:hypothetical protein
MQQLPTLDLFVYPQSVVNHNRTTFFLARTGDGKRLGVQGNSSGFRGEMHASSGILLCPLTSENAAQMRNRLPWLNPSLLGLHATFGFGDRLGLATPGHLRALRKNDCMLPILAQQSMRENARTRRTPQDVLDDAMWGVFEEGWRRPWGADADHLKTPEHIDLCLAAGYTFFTLDPGDQIDNQAHTDPLPRLNEKIQGLPWDALDDTPDRLRTRYLRQTFTSGEFSWRFDDNHLLRAACKYGHMLAYTANLYRHLESRSARAPFEVEISVDEALTPTTPLEHLYIVRELQRLGVHWVSLAPRYIGHFYKGVDYVGDLQAFETDLAQHAAIAKAYGPYKLSLHSGSDKFSTYPLFARYAGQLFHLKTAGTSYLEALRVIAKAEPGLFAEILSLARARYEEDKVTYHIAADLGKVPPASELGSEQYSDILHSWDGRQVLHVTFGSILDQFGPEIIAMLKRHEEAYYQALEAHFSKHLAPFCPDRTDA